MIRVIYKIKKELLKTFYEVNDWFNVNDELLNYSPSNGGWSIKKILEHISITNQYLLILINKATRKSLENARKVNDDQLIIDYDFDWDKLNTVGRYGSFVWNRPEHMEPTGNVSPEDVKQKLKLQVDECLNCLNQLSNGEGAFYKTMMSVNGIGKIDVYHYIYFLAQHAKRHLVQMQKVKDEFLK